MNSRIKTANWGWAMALVGWLALLLLGILSPARYDDTLCLPGERLAFGFSTEDGKKVAVCIADEADYLVVRYGTRDKVEMEYPQNKCGSWQRFTYQATGTISDIEGIYKTVQGKLRHFCDNPKIKRVRM